MNEPVRRIRRRPLDLNVIYDVMEGREGSVTLHFTREGGLREDRTDVRTVGRLLEAQPARDNQA